MPTLVATLRMEESGRPVNPKRSRGRWSSAAVLLLALIALSALAQMWPAALAGMQYDRPAIDTGQWWRLLTGNLVHYDWVHLSANLGAFAFLGWMALGRARGALWVVPISAAAIGAGVYVWADGVATYRGISGMACALLSWMLVVMAIEDRGWKAIGWLGLLLLVIAKSVYETATGVVLLPTSAPRGVDMVGITHVVGLAIGALMGMGACLRSTRPLYASDESADKTLLEGLVPERPVEDWIPE